MQKKIVKILAVILSLTFVLSLAACKKDPAEETTTQAPDDTTVSIDDTSANDETTLPEETTDGDETTTEEGKTDSTANEGTDPAPVNKMPTTWEEIAAYYNAAANKVKKDKPAYSITTKNHIGEITSTNSLIEKLIGVVKPMFAKDEVPVTVEYGKGDPAGRIPVSGQSYGGKIQASSLSDASCVDKGSYYELTMKFKPEKLSALPTNAEVSKVRHGQAFNLLTKEIVDNEVKRFSAVVKLGTFAPEYKGCHVIARVDKATERLTYAELKCVNTSQVVAKAGFTLNVSVEFGNTETYNYKY